MRASENGGAARVRRWGPVFCGVVTALLYAWVWGSLRAVPVIHDEAAYLLQARIFASGRWTAPRRPLPEFFEQMHVFVTPRLASKYPPAHSMFLVPGIWLGLPGIMPILASGFAAGLLFGLVRRISGPGIALLSWVLWLLAPGSLAFFPSYLSQSTSTLLCLSGWWCLWRWRESERQRFLLGAAAAFALGLLARPFTFAALLLPAAAVAIRFAARRGAGRQLAAALIVGAAILSVIPLWNLRTTGSWRTTPYALYSETYFPYEKPGFGLDPSPGRRPLPPDLEAADRDYRAIHAAHTPGKLPAILAGRARAIAERFWGGAWPFLLLAAVAGAVPLGAEAAFGLASAALLVAAHLGYAHLASWAVYYVEVFPVLAFLTARGLARAGSALTRMPGKAAGVAALLIASSLLPGAWLEREDKKRGRLDQETFRSQIESLPGKSVVFVRYSPGHFTPRSLIRNEPDLSAARVWTVYDRGPEDVRLARIAPERTCYIYEEARHRLVPLFF